MLIGRPSWIKMQGKWSSISRSMPDFFDTTPRNALRNRPSFAPTVPTPEPGPGRCNGWRGPETPHHSGACVRQERALFVPRDLLLPDFPGKACHSGRMLGRRWPAAPVAAGDGPQHADGESRRYVRSLPGILNKKYRGTAKRQLLCGAPFCTMCLNARLRPYVALCRVIGPSQGRRALAFQDPRERQ